MAATESDDGIVSFPIPEPKSIKPRVPLLAATSVDENKYAVDQKSWARQRVNEAAVARSL